MNNATNTKANDHQRVTKITLMSETTNKFKCVNFGYCKVMASRAIPINCIECIKKQKSS